MDVDPTEVAAPTATSVDVVPTQVAAPTATSVDASPALAAATTQTAIAEAGYAETGVDRTPLLALGGVLILMVIVATAIVYRRLGALL